MPAPGRSARALQAHKATRTHTHTHSHPHTQRRRSVVNSSTAIWRGVLIVRHENCVVVRAATYRRRGLGVSAHSGLCGHRANEISNERCLRGYFTARITAAQARWHGVSWVQLQWR
jgi:hypothetical protein